MTLDDIRTWVIAGAGALLVLVILVIPFIEKVRAAVAKATAKPLIEEHNTDPSAHAAAFGSVSQALALLRQSIENLQRQIDLSHDRRREELEGIQRQIQMAVELIGEKR